MDPRTIVCEIRCQDGRLYKVRSFVSNAYLIEMNQRIVQNPQLLVSKTEGDGYIAIFQVNRGEEMKTQGGGTLQREDYLKLFS